jgi:hypothetical protein
MGRVNNRLQATSLPHNNKEHPCFDLPQGFDLPQALC